VIKLESPTIAFESAYEESVATIKGAAQRVPYQAASDEVRILCNTFDRLAVRNGFADALSSDFTVPTLRHRAMIELYDGQFSRSKRTKALRDSLRNASPQGKCPYCGEGSVQELDHYLPKSKYAGTTVHPPNLVPSCRDCNVEKQNYSPSARQPPVLHPYFDRTIEDRWLHAVLVRDLSAFPIVRFEVRTDPVNHPLIQRLEAHMNVFSLYRRFGVWAASTLNDFERLLASPLGSGLDLAGARRHLQLSGAQQSGGHANSWEQATYQAMAHSDWYLPDHLGLR